MAALHIYKPQSAALLLSVVLCVGIVLLPAELATMPFLLLCYTAYLLHRSLHVSLPLQVRQAERLLILAPHQDDCVISAGGLALQTIKHGGRVKVVYLTQDEAEQKDIRQKECMNSWRLAGVPAADLIQLNILPGLFEQNSRKIDATAERLQAIVDDYQPTTVVFPLFEGGHRHHDISHHIATRLLHFHYSVVLLEAPMYNLYYSIKNTPHKLLKLLTRLFSLGFAKYHNPKEGVDGRPIFELKMTKAEKLTKQQMLRAFKSQGGASLATAFGHNDRFYRYTPMPFKAQAFDYDNNLAAYIERLYNMLPRPIAKLVFGGKYCCFGCTTGITNLTEELQQQSIIIPGHFEAAEQTAVAV